MYTNKLLIETDCSKSNNSFGFLRVICFFTLVFYSCISSAVVPDWVRVARIGGTDISSEMSSSELNSILNQRLSENVSVLEFDSRLSEYLTETEFDAEVVFLNTAAEAAKALGLRSVIYYPSLEVITQNGENITNTMYKDHPDWVQYGLGGEANVFYGSQEHWVDPGAESAWMSPNSPYKEYYLNRIRKLAATSLDGVWVDVPIYLDTGTDWAGAGSYAATDFRAWSILNGIGGASGYDIPATANFNDPAFRAWIRWRHENLANFLEEIRIAAHEINPDFMIVIENFPMDYMDATKAGLDGTFRTNANNFIRVWEVDSVSNTRGMQWSNFDDFSNKISMFKWANSVEHENPAWVFSYGGDSLDASLVLAAAVTTGNAPFEAQTPDMTQSVDPTMRSRWFNYIGNHQSALLQTERVARAGIWYSSSSRDYQDFSMGGEYGMYSTTLPPASDPDWWSREAEDSVIRKPHLGGYRGAGYALTQLSIPYKVVAEPGEPENDLSGLSFLWLPSVAAISDESVNIIKQFVSDGGVLLATGQLAGRLDELGNQRSTNPFADLFAFPGGVPGQVVNPFGNGLAIYRPDIHARDLFGIAGDPDLANITFNNVEAILRSYVTQDVELSSPAGMHIEVAHASDNLHYLYLLNFSGLQFPLVSAPKTITVKYRVPAGYQLATATTSTPDLDGQQGTLTITEESDGRFSFEITIDQFSLIELTLINANPGDNNPPVANSDNLSTEENISLDFTTIQLLSNDADFDGDELILSSISSSSTQGATITEIANDVFRYVPSSGFTGTDSFNYTISDGRGGEATGTVFVVVNPGPVPLPSVYYPETIHILSGSYDWGTLASFTTSDSDTYDMLTEAENELQIIDWYASTTLSQSASSITQMSVVYRGQYSVAAVTQTFYLYNFATTNWDFFDSRNVSNTDDVTISVQITSNVQQYISSSGEVRARIRGEKSDNAFFVWANFLNWEIMDTEENRPPIANDNTMSILQDTPVTFSETLLLSNDSDPDGDIISLNYIDAVSTQGGTIAENGDGSYLYTPPLLFVGTDTFNYWIADGNGGEDVASVLITINAPSNINPQATDDTLTTLQNTTVEFTETYLLANDSDANNDPLVFTNISTTSLQGGNITSVGNENYLYTPPLNYTGTDSFTYSISDGNGGTDTAIVTVTILEPDNNPPVANNDSYQTAQNTSFTFFSTDLLNNDSDPDGDGLFINAIDLISQFGGSISSSDLNIYTYTPSLDFSGNDTFSYSISDGKGGTASAIVSINVLMTPNSPPIANDDTLITNQGVGLNFTATDLLANDTDADGDSIFVSNIDLTSSNGGNIQNTGAGNYLYTPSPGFFGIDLFTYQISDGNGGTDSATINFTVIQIVNAPPVANNDNFITIQNTSLLITYTQLLANDIDSNGDPLLINNHDLTSFQGGIITNNNDGSLSYTPPIDFIGMDNFVYEIDDGHGGTASAQVIISILASEPTPENETYFPDSVSIDTGTYDWGTMASLLSADNDTYDIRSTAVDSGELVDWFATTQISGPINQVSEIEITYSGQYSRRNVSQVFYLYNYQNQTWQHFNTQTVGNTDDVTISIEIESNPQQFISATGEMRVRIQGYRSTRRFFVWANLLSWEVDYENSINSDTSKQNSIFLNNEEEDDEIEFIEAGTDSERESEREREEENESERENDGDNESDNREYATGVILNNVNAKDSDRQNSNTLAGSIANWQFLLILSGSLFYYRRYRKYFLMG